MLSTRFVVVALVVAVGSHKAALAASPCDPGWTYFPDADLVEQTASLAVNGLRKFGGSCLRLYPGSVPVLTNAGRSFAVVARDTCSYVSSGGRLLSFNSLDTGVNALLPVIKGLIAGANGTLVLTGGFQNPNIRGGATLLGKNFIWSDAYTNPDIIATGNWAAGQPDDTGNFAATGAVNGTATGTESSRANFLAIHKSTAQFYDVTGTERMDFVCMYRAPAPCPPGYRYYAPLIDATDPVNEYGLASCLKVVTLPTTVSDARSSCATPLSAAFPQPADPLQQSLWVPDNSNARYAHLATYHALNGTGATPLTTFVRTLAQRAGLDLGTTLLWTGATLVGTPDNNVKSWVDGRVFDSTVVVADPPSSVTGSDGYEIVLNMSGPFPVLQTYRDAGASSSLAYVCEADVAVRINNSAVGSIMGNYGKVISYAVPGIPSGYMACANKFNALSGNVACKQAGYDQGRGSSGSAREESGGVAPRVIVGTGCGGSENFLEDCADSLNTGAVPFSESACPDPHITLMDCAMENMVPGQFPTATPAAGPADLASPNSNSKSTDSSSDNFGTPIIVVVVVVGAFYIVLAVVYIVKGVTAIGHNRDAGRAAHV